MSGGEELEMIALVLGSSRKSESIKLQIGFSCGAKHQEQTS